MKINRWDMGFVGLAAAVIAFFFAISGEEKTKPVPYDTMHQPVYGVAYRGVPGRDAFFVKRMFFRADKKGAEKYCEPCHLERKVSFPPNHPPKNRCLFCHKLQPLNP